MAVVNIRDFPEELHREAKAQAALEGVSLKEIIIRALTEYLEKKGRVSNEKIKKMQSAVRQALEDKGSKKRG